MKDEIINMSQVWTKSESLMGIKPITSQTLGRSFIHWATRTHGEQGHFSQDRAFRKNPRKKITMLIELSYLHYTYN